MVEFQEVLRVLRFFSPSMTKNDDQNSVGCFRVFLPMMCFGRIIMWRGTASDLQGPREERVSPVLL